MGVIIEMAMEVLDRLPDLRLDNIIVIREGHDLFVLFGGKDRKSVVKSHHGPIGPTMKTKVKRAGDNFVLLTSKAQSRVGVMRLSRSLVGPAASFPNFTLAYFHPEQFPGYLAKRFLLSARLALLAHYLAFLFRPADRHHVARAIAQHGTGTAGAIQRDAEGRVVYSGNDARLAR